MDDKEHDKYLEASVTWEDPDVAGMLDHLGERVTPEGYQQHLIGRGNINRVKAVGGPFDGEELSIPPGGQEVILPAAFGKTGDMRGKVIYRRKGDVMAYVGQPDQTDEAHTDEEEDDTPKLVIP